MYKINKSRKLDNVCYDIRGPVLKKAKQLEEEGFRITKLNIGNPAPFGFMAPEEVIHDVILNMPNAQGYTDSQGLFSARKAVMHECQKKKIQDVEIDDIWIGNGVSELISISMQALLNDGDEILIPAPDYPLWTAAATLSGGKVKHYHCDEQSDWYPDLVDIESKISKTTKGIVVINPNNPTGSLYPREILEGIIEIARKHSLIIFADEIYDKIVYDGHEHISIASLTDDVIFLTYNGLSKAYRAAGFRGGWMIISGRKQMAEDYIEGLNMLSNMRLCSNVPAQFAIQTALGGYQSVNEFVLPKGRLTLQRNFIVERLNSISGISCTNPRGALYVFPKIDTEKFNITNDQKFIYDTLVETKILMVQGTGFNWPEPDHFRIVFLPHVEVLKQAMDKFERFLSVYRQV